MLELNDAVSFLIPEQHMVAIYRVLKDVREWKELADSLNISSDVIEEYCARDVAQASGCCRRELVRQYCDKQLSENPHKVAEDIATKLEEMDHNRQAQQLKNLVFGKSACAGLNQHSSSLADRAFAISQYLHYQSNV